jgi:hypothetical protein
VSTLLDALLSAGYHDIVADTNVAIEGYDDTIGTIRDLWNTLEHQGKWALLYRHLHTVWDDAPDSRRIHSWPSWGRFCDLLSEGAGMEGITT